MLTDHIRNQLMYIHMFLDGGSSFVICLVHSSFDADEKAKTCTVFALGRGTSHPRYLIYQVVKVCYLHTKEVRRAKGAAAVFRNNTHPKQSQPCSCVITGPQPKSMLKALKITVSVAIQNLIDSSFGSPNVNRGNSH